MWFLSRYLDELRAAGTSFPDAAHTNVDLRYPERDKWALGTLAIAISEIGHGELPGQNNVGPDIQKYCAPHGDHLLWCAGYGGWCIGTAAEHLGYPMLVKKSLSAKTLAENIAAVGHRFDDWRLAKPGDFFVFKRTGGHHFTTVETIDVDHALGHLVEGNHLPLVCRNIRDLKAQPPVMCVSLRLP